MHDVINIDAFIRDTKIDIKNSKESTYSNHVVQQKTFVSELYDTFEEDRLALNKLRKAVKAIHSSGMVHIQQEMSLAQHLAALSDRFVRGNQKNDSPLVDEQSIGTSISKFSIFYREQAKLQETLMQNMRNTLLHPLESFLKGAIKGDIKKPVDKTFKEFDNRYEKMRKEMLHQAKENGQDVTPGDLERSVERERRMLQLSIVKYLIQISEMQSKEGAELVQYLIAFYQAQKTYFTESVKVLEHLGMFLVDVECQVREIKARQDDQRRTLVQVKEDLSRLVVDKENPNVGLGADTAYSLHQPDQVATAGTCRSGYLLKRSEGKVKRLWQRRHVAVKDGFLFLSHADETKPPVKLNLLTCHIKPNSPEADPRCFDLLSNNRTYHFQAELEADRQSWVAVINNAKRAVFDLLMQADSGGPANSAPGSGGPGGASGGFGCSGRSAAMAAADQQLRELRNEVLTAVRQLPGNESCADCGAGQPEWVSVNLGVLICLECCGLHRELGVHHSRTQSLIMDDLKSSQLLLPRFIGNQVFNEVFESTMPDTVKPSHVNGRDSEDTRMEQRKAFIRAKYVHKRYVCGTSATPASLRHDLQNAVTDANMSALLQCFGEAEGVDLLVQFDDLDAETALHLVLREGEDSTHLHLVQFLLENSPCSHLARVTRSGDSLLHYCCRYNRPESLKLVLRALQTEPSLCSRLASALNNLGESAADVASPECSRLLQMVLEEGRWELCEHVDTDWDLAWCEQGASFCDYFSEEELDGAGDAGGGGGLMVSSMTGATMRDALTVREPRTSEATGPLTTALPTVEPVPARRGSIGRPQSLCQSGGDSSGSSVSLRNGGTDSPRRAAPARPPQPRLDMSAVPVGCTLPRRGRSSAPSPAVSAATAVSVARRQSLKGPAPPPPKPQASVAPQPAAPPPQPPPKPSNMGSKPLNVASKPEPPPKRPVPRPRRSTDSTSSIGSNGGGSGGTNNAGNNGGSSNNSNNNSRLQLAGGRSGNSGALASWFGETELFSSPLSTPHRAETLGRPKKKKRDKNSREFGSLEASRAMSHSTDHINVLLDVLQEEGSASSGDEEGEAVGRICKALFSCQADAPGDLAFSEGENIRVTKVENDQWWHGVIEDDPSRQGLFPVTYVHIIK